MWTHKTRGTKNRDAPKGEFRMQLKKMAVATFSLQKQDDLFIVDP